MKPIIVPTDFSPIADNALQYALDLAKQYQLDIQLLHVVQFSTPDVANIVYADSLQELVKEATKKMEEKKATLQEANPTVLIEAKVEAGILLDSLEDLCNEINPILVMMGITGSGTGMDKLIGSNAIAAMHHLHTPIMIIPKESTFSPLQKICFACDLKNVVQSIPIGSIKLFATLFQAKVHILNIDFHHQNMTGKTLEEYNTLESMLDDIPHEFHFVEDEHTPLAIDSFCTKNKMDLLIMVPKKYSFVKALFHTSQSKSMAYASHVPILNLHQD
jgi:nucleotide-binding universal stress UspA family protein